MRASERISCLDAVDGEVASASSPSSAQLSKRALHEQRQHLLPVPGRRERVGRQLQALGRVRGGIGRPMRLRPGPTPPRRGAASAAPTPEAATRTPSAPRPRSPRASCSGACAGGRAGHSRTVGPTARRWRARAARSRSRGTPRRPRSSRRRRPTEVMRAPSASNGACRSPRGAEPPAVAQRLPPIVPTARISPSATCSAAVTSGSGASCERADRRGRTDADDAVRVVDAAQPGAAGHQDARGPQLAVGQLGQEDRASAHDRDARAVAEGGSGLGGRGRRQQFRWCRHRASKREFTGRAGRRRSRAPGG